MNTPSATPIGNAGFSSERPKNAISSSVLGVIIFIATEMMFFAGLVSAHSVISNSVVDWPPADQPRLPIEATALNSLFLLASGLVIFFAWKAFKVEPFSKKSRNLLVLSIALGSLFVGLQGSEWAGLISHGLTINSSVYGGFFYLIIGAHAIHAVGAILALLRLFFMFQKKKVTTESFTAHSLFWYFVVGVWPVLYVLVYL
ncbi:cytochrome c oxidase subunit 3 [Puniceicoccaceae bacterium K14]|nr:cytochrome c oxidase subunit 3 [Puniceicoccaceae bacterium K14]